MAKILFVLTSHTNLPGMDRKTGFYFEEMATPFYILRDAGHDVTLSSIAGGKPEADPASLPDDPAERQEDVARFLDDAGAMAMLETTKKIDDVCGTDFDAVFLPGGHGAMWDFPENGGLREAIEAVDRAGGVIGAVCHGPAGLLTPKRPDGTPLVENVRMTAFTDAEERAMELETVMPFLLESRLRETGADFSGGEQFGEVALRHGRIVTGQNPQSSAAVGRLLLEALDERRAAA